MTRRARKNNSKQAVGDVTIADFANNEAPRTRISKVHISPKSTFTIEAKTDEIAGDSSEVDECDIDADVEATQRVKPRRQPRSNAGVAQKEDGHVYAQHHFDVWFQISEHIPPEDVGRFSQICQLTAQVCRTAKFWRHLYNRFYDEQVELPARLQPACMVRLYGLRTCTIRSLFYLYPPLKARIADAQQQNIITLLRLECLTTWVVNGKDDLHYYCFKFKKRLLPGSRLAQSESIRRENVFEKVSKDIFNNPEEGCKIMVVLSKKLRPLPFLCGQQSYLDEVKHSLTSACSEYRLKMSFVGSGHELLSTVFFEPVQEIRVIDWWMPAYEEHVIRAEF